MANVRSAVAEARKSKRRHLTNQSVKSAVKTAFKRAEMAIRGKKGEAAKFVKEAVSIIDKAVSSQIIHKNTAARKKSRLLARYNAAISK